MPSYIYIIISYAVSLSLYIFIHISYISTYLFPHRKHLHPYGSVCLKKPIPTVEKQKGQTAESFVSVVSATSAASQQTALTAPW